MIKHTCGGRGERKLELTCDFFACLDLSRTCESSSNETPALDILSLPPRTTRCAHPPPHPAHNPYPPPRVHNPLRTAPPPPRTTRCAQPVTPRRAQPVAHSPRPRVHNPLRTPPPPRAQPVTHAANALPPSPCTTRCALPPPPPPRTSPCAHATCQAGPPPRLHTRRWAHAAERAHTPLRTRPVHTAPLKLLMRSAPPVHKPLRTPCPSRARAAAHTLPKTQPRPRPPPHPRMLSKLSRKQLQL